MNRIVMFSDLFLPTFPYLEIPMYEYLLGQGVDVRYVLHEKDIRLTDPILSKTFSKLKSIQTIKNPKNFHRFMLKGDLFLSRFAYKLTAGDVAAKVRGTGRCKILMYDPSGIDIRVRECPAHYLTAKSENLKQATLKKFRKYKHIFVTGTIHTDAAATTEVNRDEFMRSYGFDPEKKLAILTPANPGEAWMEGIQEDYKKIIETVRKNNNYEIAIKCHPFDYTSNMKKQPGIIHKNDHYAGKPSWEILDPSLKVIKAEEGYKALKACDVILNIRSSIAMETALFNKPLVNINRHKYVTNWPFDENTMIDINLEDLAYVLNTGNYHIDEKACEDYVKRECYSGDGKAYERTGNVAIKILDGKI